MQSLNFNMNPLQLQLQEDRPPVHMKPTEAAEPLAQQAAAAAMQLSSKAEGVDLVEAQRKAWVHMEPCAIARNEGVVITL